MKLCYIAKPQSIHVQRWLRCFVQRGHEVHLVAEHAPAGDVEGVHVHDLTRLTNIRKLRFVIWAWAARRLMRFLQPDILHAFQVTSAGWLGAASGFHPFVVTPMGSDLNDLRRRPWLYRPLAGFVIGRADLITTDAAELRDKAVALGARPQRCREIQFGVDLDTYSPGPTAVRQELGITAGPVILSPRGMRPAYNIEVIVRAIPGVRATFPDVLFILRDLSTDFEYREKIKNLIEELGVAEAVRLVGNVPPERIADYYRAADVMVSVPVSDSTPVSLLEAMACGVPVIVSDLPALREWIVNGENGLLVPVGDAETLASTILRLLRDGDLRNRCRQRNLELVRQRADQRRWMEKMEILYRELVEKTAIA